MLSENNNMNDECVAAISAGNHAFINKFCLFCSSNGVLMVL